MYKVFLVHTKHSEAFVKNQTSIVITTECYTSSVRTALHIDNTLVQTVNTQSDATVSFVQDKYLTLGDGYAAEPI